MTGSGGRETTRAGLVIRDLVARTLLALAPVVACPPADAAAAEVTVVLDDLVAPGDLAVTPNGQTGLCLDRRTGGIVAFDPREPGRRRVAVAAPAAGQPRASGIGCIDTTTVVAACRGATGISLRTWRLAPDRAGDPAAPLQELALPELTGDDGVPIAVSPTRDWLAVVAARPPGGILRGPIAGVRLGRLSDRGCPRSPPADLPVALAVNAADQFVVIERPPGPAATDRLACHEGIAGRRLLALDTGLRGIRDVAVAPGDGGIFVAVGPQESATRPAGLWRLDAAIRSDRQVVQAVCVAPLDAIQALVCPTDTAILVSQAPAGAPRGRVLRIDLPRSPVPGGPAP